MSFRQKSDPEDDLISLVSIPERGKKTLLSGISPLKAFYRITSRVSMAVDVNEVLMRFIHTISDLSGAKAGAIRLLGDDGQLHLVSSVGLDEDIIYRERVVPSDACVCGKTGIKKDVLFQKNLTKCSNLIERGFLEEDQSGNESLSMIVGAIKHRNRELGIFNLYVEKDGFEKYYLYEELFSSAGDYVGLAVEKVRLAQEADKMSVVEERTRLANELHDSLAQTMAGVRFQVRVLDDTLHEGNEESLWEALEKIENSLDEANDELRELIGNFRAPMDDQGVISGITRAVERFRRYSNIPIFFQRDWPDTRLPAEYELQIVRIVQESLANIRKHSCAKNVRVMLKGTDSGEYRVLIEDDGVGLPKHLRDKGNSGEHIGLSIMKDRARRIRGDFSVESETGEGTRVLLRFQFPKT